MQELAVYKYVAFLQGWRWYRQYDNRFNFNLDSKWLFTTANWKNKF